MGAARDFKFGVQIDRQTYKPRNAKVGQKGVGYVTWPTFIVLEPAFISGMGKDTDLKFSVRIELNARKPKNAKVGQ